LTLAGAPAWKEIKVTARGGGTGTNGQSLLAQRIDLVEYAGDDLDALNATLAQVDQLLAGQAKDATGRLTHVIARGEEAVNNLREMRKRAVGLLGKLPGRRRPVPLVEDTAVPPERLADYIADFRALLDSHQFLYGMFGHVDAGVLHVHPALGMTEPRDNLITREVSDQVARLTAQYGGVLWREHGKGFRSQYAPGRNLNRKRLSRSPCPRRR
jgi:FAD/FMN-containing dehydrogenase